MEVRKGKRNSFFTCPVAWRSPMCIEGKSVWEAGRKVSQLHGERNRKCG